MGGSPWGRIKQTVNQSVVLGLLLIRARTQAGDKHIF